MEPNVSIQDLTAFKNKITQEIGMVAQFLSTVLLFPSAEAAAELLTAQSHLVISAYPRLDLTSKQKEAIGMETNPEYYLKSLVHAIELLLQGFTDRSSSSS